MRIAIRVDGDVQSKMDRCLALSSAFRENLPAAEIYFLSACTKAQAAQITTSAFILKEMEKAISSWDMEATLEQIVDLGIDMIIIDKEVDKEFVDSIKEKTFVALFDESESEKNRNSSPHVIINTQLNAHLIQYKSSPETELLLGTDFIPLSKSFDEYSGFKRENPENARKIIIYFQKNYKNLTLLTVRSLKKLKNNFSIVILAPMVSDSGEELASEIGLDSRFNTISDQDPVKRIASADILITEPSFIPFVLALSIPSIILSSGFNQASEYAVRSGLVISLNRTNNSDPTILAKTVAEMISDKGLRDRMSLRMIDLVDGLGRYRLTDELLRIYNAKKQSL